MSINKMRYHPIMDCYAAVKKACSGAVFNNTSVAVRTQLGNRNHGIYYTGNLIEEWVIQMSQGLKRKKGEWMITQETRNCKKVLHPYHWRQKKEEKLGYPRRGQD